MENFSDVLVDIDEAYDNKPKTSTSYSTLNLNKKIVPWHLAVQLSHFHKKYIYLFTQTNVNKDSIHTTIIFYVFWETLRLFLIFNVKVYMLVAYSWLEKAKVTM